MEPLLKIRTIPLEYEMTIQHARLERGKSSPPLVEMSRERGGFNIQTRPAKLLLDTYEARGSIVPTTRMAVYQNAQRGLQAAGQAAQSYASEASRMKWSKPGEGGEMLDQSLAQRMQLPPGEFQLGFIPSARAEITYQPGSITMNYQMDRLMFDAKLNNGDVEYIPWSIEFVITQWPDVQIEYMGRPVYVPPSAAERFEGETMDLSA